MTDTTPNPTAEQIAGEISEARRWIELHEGNKYQREAAKRMKRLVSVLETLRAHGMLSEGAPSEEQIDPVLEYLEEMREEDRIDYVSYVSLHNFISNLTAAGVAPQEKIVNPDESFVETANRLLFKYDNDKSFGVREFGAELERLFNEREVAQQEPSEKCTCPSGDGSLRWPCPSHPPVSPPDREKLIGKLRRAADAFHDEPGWLWACELVSLAADALAAQPVLMLDPEKVADVVESASMEWQFKFDQYRSETGDDPGPKADCIARALCEAAKRGELT